MRRREFVATAAGLASGALAGCLDSTTSSQPSSPSASGPENSPWDSETLVVGRDGLAGRVDGGDQLIRNALEFWETDGSQYLDYPASFEYEPDAESPQIVVQYVDEVTECGETHGGDLLGCSPIVRGDADEPVTARIEVGHPKEDLLRVIKHELGHALGLTHGDEPAEVMSNDPADYIENYETKQKIVDTYNSATQMYNSALSEYDRALDDWKEERYERVMSAMGASSEAFRLAAADYEEAADAAVGIDESEVAEMIRRAERKASLYAEATGSFRKAAESYADGNSEQAESDFNDYRETVAEAQEVEIPDGSKIISELNLD